MASSIAFFEATADGLFTPTQFSRSLWAPGTLNGPAVCAIAARDVELEFSRPGFRPARFTIDLFKAARQAPTATRSRLVRDGRRISVAETEVVQYPGDRGGDADAEIVVARATTVFLQESQSPPGERWSRPEEESTFHPPTAAPDDLMPWFSVDDPDRDPDAPAWNQDMGSNQTPHRKRLWTRSAPPVVGEELTPFQRAVTSAESTSLVSNWGSTGIGFINCDLTVALSRLPGGERVGIETDTHIEDDGISVSTATLYDVQGPFGTGIVTAVNNSAAQIDFTTADTTGRYKEA
ncbi:acyl-CoA thioesterase domain-containing protein [Gordonia soli]|uniref:Thioesterase family protein n=1 Tax=Gordonia soli NBRC 108243 TaxID=1223545 RepID=M0QQT2_9ACTN|nr:acyl-CoA thioesterase domain-containing protein [Gordonia soli]GAC70621.1 hypothetical protein GS4_38_00270 [Gordonia soli NBRC 108243]